MRNLVFLLWLLSVPLPGAAQFAEEDFALTDCWREESLFASGLEHDESLGARPSGGGETAIGPLDFEVAVPDTARVHPALLQVPAGYDPSQAWPLVVALHGSQPDPAAAAAQIRSLWSDTVQAEGVLLLAPIATGASGGWSPGRDTPALACAIAEVERRYNVDRARRYLWGFSAGGHYAHALALANSTRFAAYAVSAGALLGYACGSGGGATDCAVLLPTATRKIPVQVRTGSTDPLYPHAEADRLRFVAAGWVPETEVRRLQFNGGHSISGSAATAAWSWFEGRSLPF